MAKTWDRLADWLDVGQQQLPEVIALRRAIHAEPEIGLHTPNTTAKIKDALAGLPLEIHDGRSTSGFVAILRGGVERDRSNQRTVLLRTDMDALPLTEETGADYASTVPGAMHACGHDVHAAMLVGAARALCDRRDALSGTVVFMFRPGEEGCHGARHMIEDGLLEIAPPDAAFAMHISPVIKPGLFLGREGALLASTDTLLFTVRGKGGHAAQPHETIDPIPVAAEIVLALQTFVARRVPVTDPAVLSITQVHAGSSHNIVPEDVNMVATLRTQSPATRALVQRGARTVAENIAVAHGCTCLFEIDEGYPVTVNDRRATAMVRDLVIEQAGERGWYQMAGPVMGGEDFSYVLQEYPGAMTFLGLGTNGPNYRDNPPLHSPRMMIEEGAMADGVAMHCATAARFLARGFDA